LRLATDPRQLARPALTPTLSLEYRGEEVRNAQRAKKPAVIAHRRANWFQLFRTKIEIAGRPAIELYISLMYDALGRSAGSGISYRSQAEPVRRSAWRSALRVHSMQSAT
jgi:hypothetical protein